jgi:hypothetical protein
MVTTTLTNMRKELSEATGDYFSFSSSANGNDAGTSILADSLKNRIGGTDNNGFRGQYFLSVSGNNSGEFRRCDTYAPNTEDGPLVLVQSAYSNAVASGDTFELHRIDPDIKQVALDQASAELFGVLYLPIKDESTIVDSRLLNGGFENFSSTDPDNWTKSGAGTPTRETAITFHGSNSFKMEETGGSEVLRYYQDLDIASISGIVGTVATFKMWSYATAASTVRIILEFGSSSTEEASGYHGGASEWEQLSVSVGVPSGASRVRCILEVTASGTGYFDAGWASTDSVHRYTVPTSIVEGPTRIHQQYNETLPDGPYYPIPAGASPTQGRILRLEGKGVLSRPSTESGTIEIAEPRLSLFRAMSALKLVEILGEQSASEQITVLDRRIERWERTVSRLSRQPGVRMPPMPVESFRGVWEVSEDSDGRYVESIASSNGTTFTS